MDLNALSNVAQALAVIFAVVFGVSQVGQIRASDPLGVVPVARRAHDRARGRNASRPRVCAAPALASAWGVSTAVTGFDLALFDLALMRK